MTETQQRFLRAIAERVPTAQVVELHLFPPIRQGGVETGVAVVAEDPRLSPPAALDSAAEPGADDAAAASELEPSATSSPIETPDETASLTARDVADTAVDLIDHELQTDDSTNGNGDTPSSPPPRLTIHTARYRLTLKGVDRGKWEVDVVAEADAPLDAVDAVVRGVQRRGGEGAEPDRLTNDAFREALDAPLATLER